MSEIELSLRFQQDFMRGLLPLDAANGVPSPSLEDFLAFYKSSVNLFSVADAIALARDHAEGTTVPPEFDNDIARIIDAGSLSTFISMIHEANDASGFNLARAQKMFGALSDEQLSARHKELVFLIASSGSPYVVPPDFAPMHTIQALRQKTLQLGLCQLAHAVKLRKKNKCLLLKISDLPAGFLELCGIDVRGMAHWTLKFAPDGSILPEGRFLIDLNHDPTGANASLNSDEAKSLSNEFYGPLTYPNIIDFIRDVYLYCTQYKYDLKDIRFFVEDNKGAFNTHKKDPAACPLVCIRVSHDYLMLPLYGMFGHHAEPAVWEQPAAALDVVLRLHLHGVFRRYVDDRFHAAHFAFVASDHAFVTQANEETYGPHALDPEKAQRDAFEITAIGWVLNSLSGLIRPSDKAIRKLVVAFFSISIHANARWSLKQIQMLGSLAERYSLCLINMRSFVNPFHNLMRSTALVTGAKRNHILRDPDAPARFAVMMWRSVAITLFANPNALSVPMFSLLPEVHSQVSYYAVTDAANKLGIMFFDASGVLLSWTSFGLPFDAPDADFQNAKEFMGLLGVLVIMRLRFQAPPGSAVSWRTDSMTSISWVQHDKARSAYGQYAFAAFSLIRVLSRYCIPQIDHSAGVSDIIQRVDDLSRDVALDSLDQSLRFDLHAFPAVVQLFSILDPTQVNLNTSCHSILQVFTRVTSLVAEIFR